MRPQVGASGAAPRPRKDSTLSVTTQRGRIMAVNVTSGPARLGMIWRNNTRQGPAPETMAAATYSSACSRRRAVRATWAKSGAKDKANASTSGESPGPIAASAIKASSSGGKPRSVSITAKPSASAPRPNPANSSPAPPPTSSASKLAKAATASVVPAPAKSRDKTSRPK